MKKTYFQPACVAVELDSEQMVAESAPSIGVNPGDPGDPGTPGDELDTKENKSIWDEEW